MGCELKYQQPGNTGQDTSTEREEEQEIACVPRTLFGLGECFLKSRQKNAGSGPVCEVLMETNSVTAEV